jgi:hypothetical protein
LCRADLRSLSEDMRRELAPRDRGGSGSRRDDLRGVRLLLRRDVGIETSLV